MKYALIKDGIVAQAQPNKQDGFIECDNSVVCGMLFDGAILSSPEPEPISIQQQIDDLESKITTRNLVGLAKGDEYATNKINEIEAQIVELRAKL